MGFYLDEFISRLIKIRDENLDKQISVCIEAGEYFVDADQIQQPKKSDRGFYIVIR